MKRGLLDQQTPAAWNIKRPTRILLEPAFGMMSLRVSGDRGTEAKLCTFVGSCRFF